jgi:hypothetical protein
VQFLIEALAEPVVNQDPRFTRRGVMSGRAMPQTTQQRTQHAVFTWRA